jgi:hypothetical protein
VEGVGGHVGFALKQIAYPARLASHWNGYNVTQFMLVQNLENGLGTEALVQKHPPKANFERFQPFDQPTDNICHLFSIFDEAQRDHIAPVVMYNRNCGITMKMSRPGFWRTAHDLLFVLIGFTMIRDQREVNGNVVVSLPFQQTGM